MSWLTIVFSGFLFVAVLNAQAVGSAPPVPAAPAGNVVPSPLEKAQTDLMRARKTLQDWPNLNRYRSENAALPPAGPSESRVVFLGDSITDAWGRSLGQFFPGKPYVNRGISGQTTPQMLLRFRPDVIDLHPALVVVLAGTNDLAGNTGPETLEEIEGNIASMVDLARANHIGVVLSSVMPICDYIKMQSDRRPPAQILALNEWIRSFSAKNQLVYLDYFSALVDEKGMLRQQLTYDGLHPNAAGYAVMGPLASEAVTQALQAVK